MMKPAISIFVAVVFVAAAASPLHAQHQASAPFTTTLSNITPLAFGMNTQDAALALGTPLQYVSGRQGNEIFAALRSGGSGYFFRNDQLFLQFRNGRLTGWKGDWGKNWMWQ